MYNNQQLAAEQILFARCDFSCRGFESRQTPQYHIVFNAVSSLRTNWPRCDCADIVRVLRRLRLENRVSACVATPLHTNASRLVASKFPA